MSLVYWKQVINCWENLWETWKFGCSVYSPTHRDLHNQLKIMFELFWGRGWNFTCCVDQVLQRLILLWLRVWELLWRSLLLTFWLWVTFIFTWLVRIWSHKQSAAGVGLLSMAVPGQQCLCMAEQPLSVKTGEKNMNLSCRSDVNVQNYCISSLMDLPLQNE